MKILINRVWAFCQGPQAVPWLLFGAALWLCGLAWVRDLHLPDEGRYVGVAWDMARADSFWVPLMNGMPYFHKPPLFYWLDQLSFMLFGRNEWAARMPSVLTAWSTATAAYFFVRKYRGVPIATLTFIALITMPYFYGAAQYANLDMLVAGMISLTVLAGAEAVLRGEAGASYKSMMLAAATAAALGMLAKGLIGVVLPGGVLFFWVVLTGRWRSLAVLLWPPAVVFFFVLAVPWFWFMQQKFPGFFDYYFIHQQFERFVGESFNNPQPVWFYIPVVFGMTLPWSLGLIGIMNRTFWKSPGATLGVLMVIWFFLILVFFSIPASKLIGYTVPALVPLAVLVAEGLWAIRQARGSAFTLAVIRGFVVGSAIACVVGLMVFRFIQKDSANDAGAAVAAQWKADDTLVYLRAYPFDLPFYVGNRTSAWVVENWPSLPKRDNWRNELVDAAKFNPSIGNVVLITEHALVPRLCETSDKVFWLRSDDWGPAAYPFLREIEPFFTQGNGGRVWKIKTDAVFKEKVCPKSG
jgi:4-amino-4-deoxy-L-arabinose transferase-like glycosyltransferase